MNSTFPPVQAVTGPHTAEARLGNESQKDVGSLTDSYTSQTTGWRWRLNRSASLSSVRSSIRCCCSPPNPRPAPHGVQMRAGLGARGGRSGEPQLDGEQPGVEWQCWEYLPQLAADGGTVSLRSLKTISFFTAEVMHVSSGKTQIQRGEERKPPRSNAVFHLLTSSQTW